LDYLNARYYNPSQGQFLTEDPVFWADPRQQNLQDPQSLNTYSYSVDNPITKKDQAVGAWKTDALWKLLLHLALWEASALKLSMTTLRAIFRDDP
jgi:RHS repeat-associated protein